MRVSTSRRDVLGDEPPDVDVVLAGDCWYDATLAGASSRGCGASGRPGSTCSWATPAGYLPLDDLEELATYDVRTTTELEDMDRKVGRVYRLRGA